MNKCKLPSSFLLLKASLFILRSKQFLFLAGNTDARTSIYSVVELTPLHCFHLTSVLCESTRILFSWNIMSATC
jgi:hypothetical protein